MMLLCSHRIFFQVLRTSGLIKDITQNKICKHSEKLWLDGGLQPSASGLPCNYTLGVRFPANGNPNVGIESPTNFRNAYVFVLSDILLF